MIACDAKTCTKCGATKPVDDFYRMSSKKDGRRPSCIECDRNAKRDYTKNHPVMDRCKKMGWYIVARTVTDIDNPRNKSYKEKGIKSHIGNTGTEIARYLYENFYDDIKKIAEDGEIPSVDRIDSLKGYEEGNIQIVSLKENSLDGIANAIKKTSKKVKVTFPDKTHKLFNSVSEASRELGLKRDTIIRNRDNGTKTRYGLKFENVEQ